MHHLLSNLLLGNHSQKVVLFHLKWRGKVRKREKKLFFLKVHFLLVVLSNFKLQPNFLDVPILDKVTSF